jgi:hypothetical protein
MTLLLIVVILFLCLGWGGYSTWGPTRHHVGYGWSPLGIVLVVVVLLALMGALH